MAKRKPRSKRARTGRAKGAARRTAPARRRAARPRAAARKRAGRHARSSARRAGTRSATAQRRRQRRPRASTGRKRSGKSKNPAAGTASRRRASPAARRPKPSARARAPQTNRPKAPGLQRERRRLTEEEVVPTPPSTLDFTQRGSAARSGRASVRHQREEHTEAGPALTGGDVDADWEEAYASGDEAPGGDMPTPDQDVVEEIGRALGVEYDDMEELKGADKITQRDRHRWEYDPASAEDYKDRNKRES